MWARILKTLAETGQADNTIIQLNTITAMIWGD